MAPIPNSQRDGHVLVIEDDEDICETLSLILQSRGYSCMVATDGARALQAMSSDPLPRVILLDMMMPGMNGAQFREAQLRDERLAHIPVVLLTGDGRAEEHARRLGVTRFLKKPIEIDDLIDVVANPTKA